MASRPVAVDIADHLPALRQAVIDLKAQCVVELGVRNGDGSTPALLSALATTGGTLHSVDIAPCVEARAAIATEFPDARWTFHQDDSVWYGRAWKGETIDLLLIDSVHSYEHTLSELRTFAKHVGKQIWLHDTQSFPAVQKAIDTFMAEGGAWDWKHTNRSGNNGMGVLTRRKTCADMYVLSYGRFDMLRACIISLCGYNPECRLTVIEDGAPDWRERAFLELYERAGLLRLIKHDRNMGIGYGRREGCEMFLTEVRDRLVFSDADMVWPAHSIQRYVDCFKASGLALMHPHHRAIFHPRYRYEVRGGCEVAIVNHAHEAAWITDRATISQYINCIRPDADHTRPLWDALFKTRRTGWLVRPDIPVQHIGMNSGLSHSLGHPISHLCEVNSDGSVCQPYPDIPMDINALSGSEGEANAEALRYANALHAASPVPLPYL